MNLFRRNKKVPTLNTTTTSDISFTLLIFFLVTTSMDSDKGLGRQMPPVDPDEQEEVQDVDRRRMMTIHLMQGGRITVDETEARIDDALRKRVRHFIIDKGRSHIIELLVDRDAEYEQYFKLQNQIVLVYRELRNAAARKRYGITFAECGEDQRNEIIEAYPQRIQEVTNN